MNTVEYSKNEAAHVGNRSTMHYLGEGRLLVSVGGVFAFGAWLVYGALRNHPWPNFGHKWGAT